MKRIPPNRPLVSYPWKRRRAEQALRQRMDARGYDAFVAYVQKQMQRIKFLAADRRAINAILDQDSQPSSHLFPDVSEFERAAGAVRFSDVHIKKAPESA